MSAGEEQGEERTEPKPQSEPLWTVCACARWRVTGSVGEHHLSQAFSITCGQRGTYPPGVNPL